ncbi:acyltransferase family protein [Variovorax paradoxus]|uniref:acyltransferase family protein n=1 Tax=Variovorax paradoxus TaxID=34073 RepID=UPI00193269EE|nr:acyltransferase family protein [Variovorax paradoxus]
MSAAALGVLKMVAIYSIVSAHVDVKEGASGVLAVLKTVYYVFGSMGVGLFFIVTGCGVAARPKKISATFTKLFSFYALPWVLSGCVVYSYLYFRKGAPNLSLVNFLIGNGSYLYFMPVFFLVLLFGVSLRFRVLRIFALVASLAYTVSGQALMSHVISEHLNPLLWIPYVVFGFALDASSRQSRNVFISLEFLLIIIFALWGFLFTKDQFVTQSGLNYQSATLVFLVCSVGGILVSHRKLPLGSSIDEVSKNTLLVYLWHMPLIGALNFASNNYVKPLFLVSPAIVLGCFFLLLKLARRFAPSAWGLRLLGARLQ